MAVFRLGETERHSAFMPVFDFSRAGWGNPVSWESHTLTMALSREQVSGGLLAGAAPHLRLSCVAVRRARPGSFSAASADRGIRLDCNSSIPYQYAVEKPEDIPLFADKKLVAFLRDRYRRDYLACTT